MTYVMEAWLSHFPFLLCLYILFSQESRVMESQQFQQDSVLWGMIQLLTADCDTLEEADPWNGPTARTGWTVGATGHCIA